MQLGSGARIVRSGAYLALDDAKANVFTRALETNRPEPTLTGHIVDATLAGNEVAWIVSGRRRRGAVGTMAAAASLRAEHPDLTCTRSHRESRTRHHER